VIISSKDECKRFTAVCHLTGRLSFRPPSVAEGLEPFEQEVFLCYEKRKKPPRFRGRINAQTIRDRAAADNFNTGAESVTTVEATGRQPIAVPLYVFIQNRSLEIPDGRRRWILRELHQAAAVQDETVRAHDPDGNEVEIYDPDLQVYSFRADLDQWRISVRPPEGTPYSGKWWYISLTFPDEYPIRRPVFRFISVLYHMNVSSNGRICLSVITKRLYSDYVGCGVDPGCQAVVLHT
jgi:hypothetical protein